MQHFSINRHLTVSGLVLGLAGAFACAASKDARPTPGSEQITTGGAPVVASSTPAVAAASTSPGVASGTTASSTVASAKDTAKDPPITVPSVPGRTRKDSIALVSAIRAGM